MEVLETQEFKDWFNKQSVKAKAQIQARIARIKTECHFGTVRTLEKNIAELKWKNGRRIYFSLIKETDKNVIILLLGGNKNSQSKDINKAKLIILKLCEEN